MKKLSAVILLLLIVSLTVFGCTKEEPEPVNNIVIPNSVDNNVCLVGDIMPTFPLVDTPTTLTVLSSAYEGVEPNDVYVWKKYSEMSGVNIKWQSVQSSERKTAVESALIDNQKLDLILRCKISATRLQNYGASGYIIDLAKNDLLKTYAPNCWAFLQNHPETLASITTPEGAIYSLPQVNSGAELRVSRKLFVNKKWLERVNMVLPTTTEEFYLLLNAFKTQDANGNGDASDEIPFCPIDWTSVQDCFYGSFGLGNRGVHNMTIDCGPGGRTRFIAASSGYKSFLEYFQKLYAEKLIDEYTFQMQKSQWFDNASNDRIGVFAATNLAQLPADKLNDWVAIEEPLTGPNGDKFLAAVRANFHSEGAAVIPSTCKNPELVLRWLDYFWTDEGTLFYHMGIEGETFVKNADGTYDYSSLIYDEINSGNKAFDDVVAKYSPYPGGGNPTVEIAPYFMGGEMADVPAKAARALFEYAPEEFWPSFTFTAEEMEEMNAVRDGLNACVENYRMNFITGNSEIMSWEEYLSELDKNRVSVFLVNYQKAVVRYKEILEKNA